MQDKPQRCKHFMSFALSISSLCFPNQSESSDLAQSKTNFLLLTFALESHFSFVCKRKKKKEKEIIFESGH